jgi:hypothetical protein
MLLEQIETEMSKPAGHIDTSSPVLCTDRQSRYVEAERKLAAIEQLIKPLREECEALFEQVINESGLRVMGTPVYFQDAYGVVHRIAPREWMSVKVKPYEIAHTRRPEFGEARGSLSEKEAKEQGYSPVINKDTEFGS